MISKAHIIAETRRTAKANSDKPLGVSRFLQETGIRNADWEGKYWARWGDALIEAGFQPNVMRGPRDENDLLESLATLTRELGHFPVQREIKLRGKTNPAFPSHNSFGRFGKKKEQLERLILYSKQQGYPDVLSICTDELSELTEKETPSELDGHGMTKGELGYVYLLESGRFFKVGQTNDLGRREYELRIQLPEKPIAVHHIRTDDPVGIEKYWHARFKNRRKDGEWFELTKEDVAAFKRRKFM